MWGGGEPVWLWSGFSLLYYHSLADMGWEINASQDESVQYTCTHTHTPPSSPHCAQQHSSIFFIQFPLTYQEQPAYQQREPSPSPPPSSLSRHCCCEDEMSVLLKVPLKHNSDLWCLIVSFQSHEQRWEHILLARGYFRTATTDRLYRGPGDNFSLVYYNSRNFISTDKHFCND